MQDCHACSPPLALPLFVRYTKTMPFKHLTPSDTPLPRNSRELLSVMARPFKWRLGLFFVLTLGGIIAWTVGPFIVARIVDELAATGSVTDKVWVLVGFYVLALACDEGFWRAGEWLMRSFKPIMIERVRTALFSSVLKRSHNFFVNASSGRIGHWINQTTNTANELVDTTIWNVWGSLGGMVISAVFLFYSHWALGLLFVSWLVLLFAFTIHRGKRFGELVAEQSDAQSEAAGLVVDSMSNHMSVRVYNARQREQSKLLAQQSIIVQRWRASWGQNLITNSVKGTSAAITNTIAMLVILYLYSHQQIQLGDIVLFAAYFSSASSSLWQLAWAFDNYFRSFGTMQNALDGLQGEDERIVPEKLNIPTASSVKLELQNLRFAYAERPNAPVIANLNLTIKAGEKVGVVGHSGAGKSTLIGLLLGMYEPTEGKILINNVDATEHDPSYLRAMTSFVPQDTSLFNRTIKENVCYGKPSTSNKQLTQALKLAKAYNFVNDLPDGINTVIGERGVKLSGGQRQRLAIARAILHNTPLIIMDEATSALDSVSEQAIQKALHELMKKRTSIVIAHRLSTLKHLDRIIVLDKGRVAETGTHEALLKNNGIYADLWERQKDGFIAD